MGRGSRKGSEPLPATRGRAGTSGVPARPQRGGGTTVVAATRRPRPARRYAPRSAGGSPHRLPGGVVSRAARRQVHDLHRVVAVAVAAGVSGRLIERSQAVSAPPSQAQKDTYHVTPDRGTRHRPRAPLFAEELTRGSRRVRAGSSTVARSARCRRRAGVQPSPARVRTRHDRSSNAAQSPIWNRPRYWPLRASVRYRDSQRATASASEQCGPNTSQITSWAVGGSVEASCRVARGFRFAAGRR